MNRLIETRSRLRRPRPSSRRFRSQCTCRRGRCRTRGSTSSPGSEPAELRTGSGTCSCSCLCRSSRTNVRCARTATIVRSFRADGARTSPSWSCAGLQRCYSRIPPPPIRRSGNIPTRRSRIHVKNKCTKNALGSRDSACYSGPFLGCPTSERCCPNHPSIKCTRWTPSLHNSPHLSDRTTS